MGRDSDLSIETIQRGILSLLMMIIIAGGGFWLTSMWHKIERLEQSQERLAVIETKITEMSRRVDRLGEFMSKLFESRKAKEIVWPQDASTQG